MATSSSLVQQNRMIAINTPLGKDKLGLIGFTGQEALSRLFSFEAEVVGNDPDLDFKKLMGQPASIRITTLHGGDRFFHGHINRVVLLEAQGASLRCRLSIVPWLWILSRNSDCRIYQEKTVKQIVEDVFKRHDMTDVEWRTKTAYDKWEYCVQYRESDFNFVSRLLEQEGIYYFFEHGENRHVLVLCDAPNQHSPGKGYAEICYKPSAQGSTVAESIHSWKMQQEVQTGIYEHTDYNFMNPKASLKARHKIPRNHAFDAMEYFDYPGEYSERNGGRGWAKIRLEELQARFETMDAFGDTRGIATGHTFKLKDHPRKDQAKEFLILSAQHSANAGEFQSAGAGDSDGALGYRCGFRAMDATQPFRPSRLTPKPVVQGPQTAMVVGPAGKEIWVDEHARIKVHFHWDRHNPEDDTASCWIRVAQPWAGKGFGCMNIPRIGQEVIVEFLEGDPDQPIINGRVYNGDSMPNPSNAGRGGKPGNTPPSMMTQAAMMTSFKSNSLGGSGGYNEITMNDTGGAEGLFFKAQKDEVHNVGNDREDTVANNETRKVGNDRSREVGNNETVRIGVNRDKTVGADEKESIGCNKTIDVGSNHTENIGTNMSLTVGKNQTVTVGMLKTETVGLASMETVGAAKMLTVAAAYQVSVGGFMNETVGVSKAVQVAMSSSETVGETSSLEAKKITLTADDEMAIEVGGKKNVTIGGDLEVSTTGKHSDSATEITLTGKTKITLQCGASTIVLEPALITIKAPLVKINC